MDRSMTYIGAIPRSADFLGFQKDVLYALGDVLQAIVGSASVVHGLTCSPTSPPSLNVTIGSGAIYAQETVDASAYGSLAADSNIVVKQGLLPAPTTLTIIPPTTSGYSQTYLIEAAYSDVDSGALILPYFNSANPLQPLNGPGGSNTSQYTVRGGVCNIALKPGSAAPSGSQSTPAADVGYVPLYYVTVTNGQTAITSANIAAAPGSPFIPLTLPQVPAAIQEQAGNWAFDTGTANNIALTLPAYTVLTPGTPIRFNKINTANTGACNITISVPGAGSTTYALVWADGSQLAANDLPANCIVSGTFDGTSIRLNGPIGPTIFGRAAASASLGPFYGADGGSANAIVVTTSVSIPAFVNGLLVLVHSFRANNTGATTLNVDGLGARPCLLAEGNVFVGGEVLAGGDALFEYDGANWRMISMLPIAFFNARYSTAVSLPSGTTFYVNATTGNDSNSGLSTGTAFQTIQGAINTISTKYQSSSGVNISVADGNYSGFTVSSSFIGNWNIVGDAATPTNCNISSPNAGVNGGFGISVNAANVTLSGFNINSYYTTMQASGLASIRANNLTWTAPSQAGYTIFNAYNLSSIYLYGTLSGSGNANSLFSAAVNSSIQVGFQSGGLTQSAAITLSGTPTFAYATAAALQGGSITIISSVVSFSGSANGLHYSASLNGTINTNGAGANYFPGNTAGTTASGGQYA